MEDFFLGRQKIRNRGESGGDDGRMPRVPSVGAMSYDQQVSVREIIHDAEGDPKVEVELKEGMVTSIRITMESGKVLELACRYGPPD